MKMTIKPVHKKGKQTKAKASNKKSFDLTDKRVESEFVKEGGVNPRDYIGKDSSYLEFEEKMALEEFLEPVEQAPQPALADEEAYISMLFGRRDDKGVYRNTFLAVNVWGLESRRDVKYVIDGDQVEVGGTFTVDKTTLYIRHTFPLLRDSYKKVKTSNCGTLFLVRGSRDSGAICGPLSTGPGSFIWDKVMCVANTLSFVNHKKGLDLAYLEQQLRLKMLKLFPQCPELDETIHEVISSKDFVELRTQALLSMKAMKSQVLRNHQLEHELESEPLNFSIFNFGFRHWFKLLLATLSCFVLDELATIVIALTFCHMWWVWDAYPPAGPRPVFRLANLIKIRQVCKDVEMPLQEGATLSREKFCECKGSEIDVYGAVIPKSNVVVPKPCQCNLVSALKIRFLFERKYDHDTVKRFKKFFKQWVRDNVGNINAEVPTIEQWGSGRYSHKRVEELKAARLRPLTKQKLASKCFVKKEAYVGKTPDNFKPRMIQGRHDEFLSRVGPLFYMVSKQLTKIFNQKNKFFYTNGSTAEDLGSYASNLYNLGAVYEMDVSNWDGSMGPFVLELEKWFVNYIIDIDCFSEYGDREDMELILKEWATVFGGATGKQGRVNFSCFWGRRSGDAWTSLFNTLFNFVFVNFVAVMLGTDVEGMMALGDDNVVALSDDVPISKVQKVYSQLGLKLECQQPSLETLEYCSGRFWNLGSHVKWGVKPGKVLSKFGFNFNNHSARVHKQLLHGTCKSLLPIAGHVPVLGALCRAVVDDAVEKNVKPRVDNRGSNPHKPTSVSTNWPSMDTYVQFCRIYGVDIGDVMELEERIEMTMGLDSFPCELVDVLFKSLVEVDGKLGVEDVHDFTPAKHPVGNYDYSDLSPLLEEIYRYFCISLFGLVGAIMTMLVPYLEVAAIYDAYGYISYYNLIVHACLTFICYHIGFVPSLLIHYLLNYYMEGKLNLYEIKMTKNLNKNRKQTKPNKQKRQQGMGKLDKYVVANVAPFSVEALGAKVPDSQMLPSVPITIRQSSVITADANGYGAATYKPMYRAYKFDPYAISAGGVITWHNANVVADSQTDIVPPGECQLVRFVGGGLRITYESKMDDVAGSVHLAAGPDILADPTDAIEYGALFWPIDKNEMQRSATHHDILVSEIVRQGGVEVPFLRLDNAQDLYRRLGRIGAGVVSNDLGYDQIHTSGSSFWTVYLEGLTAGSIIEVEFIAHYECVISPSHPSFLSQTPAKPSKDVLLDVVQAIHQSDGRPKPMKKSDHSHINDSLKEIGVAAVKVGKDFMISQGANFAKNVVLPFIEDAGLALLAGLL